MAGISMQQLFLAAFLVLGLYGAGVHAQDFNGGKFCEDAVAPVNVYLSRVVNRPIKKVWAKVRNFYKIELKEATVSVGPGKKAGDQIGAIRVVTYKADKNKKVMEQLIALDDVNYIQRFRMFPNNGKHGNLPPSAAVLPFPLCSLISSYQLYPVTLTSQTLIVWQINFLTTVKAQKVAQASTTALITSFIKQV